jgi:hypothetical protein
VGGRVGALQVAKARLFFQQLLGVAHIAVQEDAHARRRLSTSRACSSLISSMPASENWRPLLDLLVLDVDQHALDDVADLLHVDGEADDVGPAPALALVQGLARDLGHVVLDGRVQVVHLSSSLRRSWPA